MGKSLKQPQRRVFLRWAALFVSLVAHLGDGGLPVSSFNVLRHPPSTDCYFVLNALADGRRAIVKLADYLRRKGAPFVPDENHPAAPFLRGIAEDYEDDTPRLVYADFLDEKGKSVEAQFIRDSVALEARRRELAQMSQFHEDFEKQRAEIDRMEKALNEILEIHRTEWLPAHIVGADEYVWRRGMVDEVKFFRPEQFVEHGRRILDAIPTARTVWISTAGPNPRKSIPALSAQLSGVENLKMSMVSFDDAARVFHKLPPHLKRLTFYDVGEGSLGDFLNAVDLPKLEAFTFNFRGPRVHDEDLGALKRKFPLLTTLILRGDGRNARTLTSAGLRRLMESGLKLEHLDLKYSTVLDADWTIIARSPNSSALRSLTVSGNPTPALWEATLNAFVANAHVQPPFVLRNRDVHFDWTPGLREAEAAFRKKFGEHSLRYTEDN